MNDVSPVALSTCLAENLFLDKRVRGHVEQKQVEERRQHCRFIAVTNQEQRGRMILDQRLSISSCLQESNSSGGVGTHPPEV